MVADRPHRAGAASLLLLTAALYWLAFGLLALTMARRSPRLALLLPLLALSPPAFIFVGIIWRDVCCHHMAAGCRIDLCDGRTAGRCARRPRLSDWCCSPLGCCCAPTRSRRRPSLRPISCGPRIFPGSEPRFSICPWRWGSTDVVQVIYYGVLGATRQHPQHSIMVFDLGGISHFAKDNRFPGSWSAQEKRLITEGCYKPIAWDVYRTQEP